MAPARFFLLLATLLLAGCAAQSRGESDALPGWRDGEAKTRVLDWLDSVTRPDSPAWQAPADRIAVFDHDGTLIVEQPLVQMAFIFDRVRQLAPANPDWSATQPFATVLSGDQAALAELGFRERAPLMDAAQAGLSMDEFRNAVDAFLAGAEHPRYQRPYAELAYQPMRELIALLQAHEFRVFIVSGGGVHFIRALAESAYGIPAEHVIGSRTKTTLLAVEGRLEVVRKSGFNGLNVGRFKALNIQDLIGRRPLLAVGNSDGDLEMLKFADSGDNSLVILLQHDDAQREFVYADDSQRVRPVAAERGWLQLSMRDDFRRVFSRDEP